MDAEALKARALEFLHERRIVSRGLSPDGILLGADGWPKKVLYSEAAADLISEFGRSRGYDERTAKKVVRRPGS